MLDFFTGDRRSLPDELYHRISSPVWFYSCNGKYLFASEACTFDPPQKRLIQAMRVDPFDPSMSVDFSWEDKRRPLADVSPTGRYLVLGVPQDSSLIREKTIKEKNLYLYDTNSNETIELHLPEPLDYWNGKFHFSGHEERLIAFLLDRSAIHILIWECLAIGPRLTSYANWCLDSGIWPHQIYVHKAATSAVMVTNTRSIQRIELGDEIKFLNANKVIDDHPHRLSTISRNCSHWVLVSYGWKGGKVQTIDLTSADAPARHFDIKSPQGDIARALAQETNSFIGFSPDLRVLIINAEAFDITTTEGNVSSETLTLEPFTIEGLPALLESQRSSTFRDLQCYISPCNSLVVYVCKGDQWGNRFRYSSAIFLYRIDLEKRTSVRLELNLPEELVCPHASFHPSLPLMAISYASPTASELETILEKPPSLSLAILDLNSLEMVKVEVPEGQPTEAIAECWQRGGFLPRLLFSDCGTFAYLEGRETRKYMWYQIVHQMSISPVPSRFIDRSLSMDNSLVFFHRLKNASVALELINFDENGFWRGTEPAVMLYDVGVYSSRFAAADLYLLLGANDDQKMRLLIAPNDERTPVIKTLSLTFAEARARLEKEWQRLHAKSQDQDLGKTA